MTGQQWHYLLVGHNTDCHKEGLGQSNKIEPTHLQLQQELPEDRMMVR